MAPRPGWTYRAARRNAVLRPKDGRKKGVWSRKHHAPNKNPKKDANVLAAG